MKTEKMTRNELLTKAQELILKIAEVNRELDVLRVTFQTLAISSANGELISKLIGIKAQCQATLNNVEKILKERA
jgi:hypothetical protein